MYNVQVQDVLIDHALYLLFCYF